MAIMVVTTALAATTIGTFIRGPPDFITMVMMTQTDQTQVTLLSWLRHCFHYGQIVVIFVIV